MLRRRQIVGIALCAVPFAFVAFAWIEVAWTGRDSTIVTLPLGRDAAAWLESDRTSLVVTFAHFVRPPAASPSRSSFQYHERLGFRCNWGSESRYGGMTVFHGNRRLLMLAIPNALALPGLLTLPYLYLRSKRGLRRTGAGMCAACGYDLRASPERCPECGAAHATL